MSIHVALHARDETATARVEHGLREYFARREATATRHGHEYARLWHHASRQATGGKLVRPLVFLDMHAALTTAESGAHASDTLTELATAIELLHFSFLLHDDVIDGDVLRRGTTNLIGTIAAEATTADPGLGSTPAHRAHWAHASGVLAGDLILSDVHQLFARLDVPHATRLRLLDLLARVIDESVAGELLDVGLSDRIVAPVLATILEMCRLKTATYSFELPLLAAAALAGAPAGVDDTLSAVGRHLGVAFQLHDDVLSMFGDPAEHGKDAFSDLREGKETAIISFARMTSAWAHIEPLFGSPTLSEADARDVGEALERCGARRFVEDLIDEQLVSIARVLDESTELPEAARSVLHAFTVQLTGRTA